MLILVKTRDGFDKAINISNAEFTATKDEQNAANVNLIITRENGEIIESSMPEEKYQNLLRTLEDSRKLLVL
jgi:isocitrate/isopropylmalate dehydrogenase